MKSHKSCKRGEAFNTSYFNKRSYLLCVDSTLVTEIIAAGSLSSLLFSGSAAAIMKITTVAVTTTTTAADALSAKQFYP